MKCLIVALFFIALANCFKQAPDSFLWQLQTTVTGASNKIVINVTRSFSPNGVDRIYQLMNLPTGPYYNQNGFFRVYSQPFKFCFFSRNLRHHRITPKNKGCSKIRGAVWYISKKKKKTKIKKFCFLS